MADALGEKNNGLTGSEIGHLLNSCRITDPSPDMAKRYRLSDAFVESQNTRQDRICRCAHLMCSRLGM